MEGDTVIGDLYYFHVDEFTAHIGKLTDVRDDQAHLTYGVGTHTYRTVVPLTEIRKYTPGVPWTHVVQSWDNEEGD